nr:Putative uncharacterized protein [Moritella viscosa]
MLFLPLFSYSNGLTRLNLSIKEVMDIYNNLDSKPTLNSCRVYKK